jgi:ferredoxin/flavodoxin---NADP+ reductase
MSRALRKEQVNWVHHWNDRLFSFRTTRDPGFRFRNGHFVMVGLEVEGKPLLRAYSIASANHEEYLEFFSIKVPDGALTSRLQNLQAGDQVVLSQKPVGTLVIDDLRDGQHLYLFATGTGLAPYLSIINDPDTYERFEKIILVHGVRHVSDLAYMDFIAAELPANPYLGELVSNQLLYYPTVTREPFTNQGRIPDLIRSGKIFRDLGLNSLDPARDRAMLCGSPAMLADMRALLDELGFQASPQQGVAGDYVFERAFVD